MESRKAEKQRKWRAEKHGKAEKQRSKEAGKSGKTDKQKTEKLGTRNSTKSGKKTKPEFFMSGQFEIVFQFESGYFPVDGMIIACDG